MAYGWEKVGGGSRSGCSVVLAIFMFLGMPCYWYFSASMEAKAFNRITGNNVSTWDAMWVELRIPAPPKPPMPEVEETDETE